MPGQESHRTGLYLLPAVLVVVVLIYVAQPRHWEPRQQAAPAPLAGVQPSPRTIPPKPAMDQTQALRRAKGMCSRISKNADILADYVGTGCIATPGRGGYIDLVIVARKPIFLAPDAKKAWLLVIVGAVGKEMTDQPKVPIGEIDVADSTSPQTGIIRSFPGILAKNLRNRLYEEEISMDQAYLELLEGMHGRE